MTGRLSSFADLLIPVRPEKFFERYWESQPLHIQRSESDYYAQLLTDRDVEAAISSGGLRYPAISLPGFHRGRSARSPPQSRRSSTMRYTQTSTSLLGTPSVSVPITTRTKSSCFRSSAASVGASTSRLCRCRTAASPSIREATCRLPRFPNSISCLAIFYTCRGDLCTRQRRRTSFGPRHAGNHGLYLDRAAYRVGSTE
jgi:hypothetical protein